MPPEDNPADESFFADMPEVEEPNAQQLAFFEAAEALDAARQCMTPEEITAEEERIHQLGAKAFPEIYGAYSDDPECRCTRTGDMEDASGCPAHGGTR
jgi:hypothetical protein